MIFIMFFIFIIYFAIIVISISKSLNNGTKQSEYEANKAKIYPNINGDTQKIFPEDHCKIDNDESDIFGGDTNVDPIIENPNFFQRHHKVSKL